MLVRCEGTADAEPYLSTLELENTRNKNMSVISEGTSDADLLTLEL